MTADDRRVKERLVGASILLALLVLIVPELLSGPPSRAPAGLRLPASAPEPVRNITVDLATSKAPAADPAQPPEARNAADEPPAAPVAAAPSPSTSSSVEHSAEAPRAAAPTPATSRRGAASPPRLESAARGPTSPPPPSKPAAGVGGWAVQLGSFANRANADKLMRQLKVRGFQVYVVSGGSGRSVRYRVRIGPLADRGAAAQAAAKLKALGHASSIVQPAR